MASILGFFFHILELMDEPKLSLDCRDTPLNCLRLSCNLPERQIGPLSAAKQYVLEPAESIRGVMPLVWMDTAESVLDSTHSNAVELDWLTNKETAGKHISFTLFFSMTQSRGLRLFR